MPSSFPPPPPPPEQGKLTLKCGQKPATVKPLVPNSRVSPPLGWEKAGVLPSTSNHARVLPHLSALPKGLGGVPPFLPPSLWYPGSGVCADPAQDLVPRHAGCTQTKATRKRGFNHERPRPPINEDSTTTDHGHLQMRTQPQETTATHQWGFNHERPRPPINEDSTMRDHGHPSMGIQPRETKATRK